MLAVLFWLAILSPIIWFGFELRKRSAPRQPKFIIGTFIVLFVLVGGICGISGNILLSYPRKIVSVYPTATPAPSTALSLYPEPVSRIICADPVYLYTEPSLQGTRIKVDKTFDAAMLNGEQGEFYYMKKDNVEAYIPKDQFCPP